MGPRLSPELSGYGLVGFPTPAGFRTLRLATTMHSPARVSRRSVRPWYPHSTPMIGVFVGITLSGRTRLLPTGFRRFSPPSRGTFHLSLTLLVRYRSQDVFSLGGRWPPTSHTIFKVWYSGTRASPFPSSPTGLSPSSAARSRALRIDGLGWAPGPSPHIPLELSSRGLV